VNYPWVRSTFLWQARDMGAGTGGTARVIDSRWSTWVAAAAVSGLALVSSAALIAYAITAGGDPASEKVSANETESLSGRHFRRSSRIPR